MTGVVLALAGLTCGDGGPRVKAATAAVAGNAEAILGFEGTWEGTWEGYGEDGQYICWRVRVKGRKLRLIDVPRDATHSFAVIPFGRGAARVLIGGQRHSGIYRLDRGRLLICVWDSNPRPTAFKAIPGTDLFTLRPAPRKP